MTISDMRLYLMNRYPESMFWHQKVKKMPTKQVVAIYKKMVEKSREALETSDYHQMDMFEYMAGLTQNNTEVNV